METDPERPIEKLLRAGAKKRREEAGTSFDLHPATRRLLQGEVARTYGRQRTAGEAPAQPRWTFWKWAAWASAAVVVLATGTWLLRPRQSPGQAEQFLAQNESPAKPDVAPASAPPPPAAAPAVASDDAVAQDKAKQVAAAAEGVAVAPAGARAEMKDAVAETNAPALALRQVAENRLPQPAAATLSDAMPAASNVLQALTASNPSTKAEPQPALSFAAGAPNQLGYQSATVPQPTGAASLAKAQSSLAASATRALPAATDRLAVPLQRFLRSDQAPVEKSAGAAPSPVTAPVLASFQVEQSGSTLRIIDADGSVYQGQVQLTPRLVSGAPAAETDAASSYGAKVPERRYGLAGTKVAGLAAPTLPAYSFRVVGTNLSLNQKVTFAGSFLVTTNAAASGGSNVASSPAADGRAPVPLLKSRIQGTVKLGKNPETRLDATPAP